MEFLSKLFLDGRIADIVLTVLVIEAFALSWYSRRRVGVPTIKAILLALLPGVFLAFALRAALVHADWFWIALALLGALVTHIVDMRQRFQRRAASTARN